MAKKNGECASASPARRLPLFTGQAPRIPRRPWCQKSCSGRQGRAYRTRMTKVKGSNTMPDPAFAITTEEQLRALYSEPSPRVRK